ncbi:MAG TPA: squalene--hopene cyclase [Planctomycetes bacterium]|nr:squalene--hopene cyclase [Planctomycetota bacterium]HIL38172.1 squalene--hopene cyclase [Planctomycetota bacterium]
MKLPFVFVVASVLAGCAAGQARAQDGTEVKDEPGTAQQASSDRLAPNRADEPRAKLWSLERGEDFALQASIQWSEQRKCITCHTNGLALAALAGSKDRRYQELRSFAQGYLKRFIIDGEKSTGRRGAVEGLVMTTAMLTISDMETTGKLTPGTRAGLRWCLDALSTSGAFEGWLQCGWAPFEVDQHFGVAVLGLALGYAPVSDRQTESARRGIKRLLGWMRKNQPVNLHQKGMRLWAGSRLDGVLTAKARRLWIAELLAVQREDGGVALRDLGEDWRRADGSELSESSDAYATAFTLNALREAGLPTSRPELKKMAAWLKRAQRESGRWFSRSPHHDGKHYISHAATCFAVMALRGEG